MPAEAIKYTSPPAPNADGGGHRPQSDSVPSLAELVEFVARNRRVILATALIGALTAAVINVLLPRTYSSTAKFYPEVRQSSGGNLSGLAAQFGFSLPTGDPTQSPAFYSELLDSPSILSVVAETTYATSAGRRSLVSILGLEDEPTARQRERAIDKLRDMIVIGRSRETNVVSVTVRSHDPVLSKELAAALVATVSRFNTESRRTRADAERRFTEQRQTEAQTELREAAGRLQSFLERNLAIGHSPALRFQQDQLEREVSLREQVYSTLAQNLEQARIEAVRDTPIITVIEHATVPARPDSRHWIIRLLFGAVLGGAMGLALAGRHLVKDLGGAKTARSGR